MTIQIARIKINRWLALACLLLPAFVMAGCAGTGGHDLRGVVLTPEVVPTSWPHEFKETVTAEIVFFGKHISAVGMIDFHNARDFRLTAAGPDGKLLFDARYNWAGCHNMHRSALIPDSAVGTICRDISLALQPPNGEGLHAKEGYDITTHTDAQLRHFTYYCHRQNAQPEKLTVQLSGFDTLTIHYRRYDARGWPTQIYIDRPYRFYSVTMTMEGDATTVK
jgi:hypothetical protein